MTRDPLKETIPTGDLVVSALLAALTEGPGKGTAWNLTIIGDDADEYHLTRLDNDEDETTGTES